MPRLDPPYPSFTLVMTSLESSRLPSYRSFHVIRFHPYPRTARSRPEERLITIMDRRTFEGPIIAEAAAAAQIRPTSGCEEAPDNDTSTFELDPLPVLSAEPEQQDPPAEAEAAAELGRSKLAAALTDLLGALHCRYLTLEAVRNFLRSEPPK
ncbi:hypothetical protein BV20DRAFT_1052633 [Pilatotrama ljubarskyi]|nr:hypothetical protein BV20DRAFT_1052633 [Pilatotrama ljubarskyi]